MVWHPCALQPWMDIQKWWSFCWKLHGWSFWGRGWWSLQKNGRCIYRLSEIQGRHEIIFPVFLGGDGSLCKSMLNLFGISLFIVWVGNVIEPENVRKLQKDRNLLFDSGLWSGSMFNLGCVAEFLFCTMFVFCCTSWAWGKCWEDLGFRLEVRHFKLRTQCKLS